jgi:hypothetical protein
MKVSTLKSRTRKIWIEVPGDDGSPNEKIWVDYRPGALTLEVSEKIKEAILSGFDSDVVFVMLTNLLDGWDLQVDVYDEYGNPTGEVHQLGVTPDEIKTVPLTFLGEIITKIEDDSRPNLERDVTSDAGSQQTEQSVTSPNGTFSSEQQTDSDVLPGSSLSNQ